MLLLHLIVNHFGHSTGQLFWELQIIVESVMNRLSRNVMGLSKFPDSPTGHSPLWQWYRWWKPLRSGTSDSPPPPMVLPPSLFENCLYVYSHQGLVMVDLLDNFLNPLKLFLAVTNDFPKSPWQRFAGGKVRAINGGLQPKKAWNKSFWEWTALQKIFWHASSPVSVASGFEVNTLRTTYLFFILFGTFCCNNAPSNGHYSYSTCYRRKFESYDMGYWVTDNVTLSAIAIGY